MKKIAVLLLLAAVVLLVVAACQSSPSASGPAQPAVQPTHPSSNSKPSTSEPEEQVVSGDVEVVEASPEPTEVPIGESGAANDIPVPGEAYKLQIMRKGNSVNLQVDSTIEEVVSWYQQELPNYGWEMAGPPDSAIGAIATMLRENAAGDRITLNMQSNDLGGFVSVTIQVLRGAN